MAELPHVYLMLRNRAENVLLVREMLAGVAESATLELAQLNDLLTAVTEACNNVVAHAYEGQEGPLEVALYARAETIEVMVRDSGIGIQPRIPAARQDALGIGMQVIEALAHRVELSDAIGGGTEVRMEFAMRSLPTFEAPHGDTLVPPVIDGVADTATAIAVSPMRLARTVLPRLLSVLAAQARLSTDRVSDARLLADALAAHAPTALDLAHLNVIATTWSRRLELRVGPLRRGGAEALVLGSAIDGLGPIIDKLADDRHVAGDGGASMLMLTLLERSISDHNGER